MFPAINEQRVMDELPNNAERRRIAHGKKHIAGRLITEVSERLSAEPLVQRRQKRRHRIVQPAGEQRIFGSSLIQLLDQRHEPRKALKALIVVPNVHIRHFASCKQ